MRARPALSTCWNAHRHQDGQHLINEILLLGFDAVEFSYGFGEALFPGFREGFDPGRIKVVGARTPCPSDTPVSAGLVSIEAVKTSLHRTGKYRGDYLILTFPGDLAPAGASARLIAMARRGELHSRRYVSAKLALIKAREAAGQAGVEALRKALRTLLPVAEKFGVRLALENRARFEQFPTAREIEGLLDEFDSPWLGYWHDFGHAERQAQLGFLDHAEQIERLKSRLIGCHVHDLVWPDGDHAVPGQGIVDFDDLIPRLPKDASVVWELESRRKTADIKAALQDWNRRFP